MKLFFSFQIPSKILWKENLQLYTLTAQVCNALNLIVSFSPPKPRKRVFQLKTRVKPTKGKCEHVRSPTPLLESVYFPTCKYRLVRLTPPLTFLIG